MSYKIKNVEKLANKILIDLAIDSIPDTPEKVKIFEEDVLYMKEHDVFEIKKEHLLLIKNMYVRYDEWTEFGAPEIDPKRPYGNSDALCDMCDILGRDKPDFEEDEWFSDEEENELMNLHKETAIALQICLVNQSFDVGVYECDKYMTNWKKAGVILK